MNDNKPIDQELLQTFKITLTASQCLNEKHLFKSYYAAS